MPATISFLPKPKEYLWSPQPDITAYELASCLTLMMASVHGGASSIEAAYVLLPEAAKRHWQVVEDAEVAQFA